MSKIFISYRRDDNPDRVKLVYEGLKKLLPKWEFFYDHQSLEIGSSLPDELKQAVTDAEFVLVMIGSKWLEHLKQRKDSPETDYVYEEITTAFETKSGVIPIVIGEVSGTAVGEIEKGRKAARIPAFPSESDLVDFPAIQELATLIGKQVRPAPDFSKDIEALVGYLESRGPGVIVGSVLPGNYKLTREVGSGGMGIVYEAKQTKPNRKVAIKLIGAGRDTREVIARFDAERQALALMDHENIAQVYDVGKSYSGRPFFVMEFVDGVSITEYCDDNRLSISERLELFRKVCEAVQHAHNKGVLHRDIKPTNVLVTQVDGKAVPKVIDFGLAKSVFGMKLIQHTFETQFQNAVGTLGYSSPEQAAGKDVDTTTDVYSLGALLYEMLVGAPPFDVKALVSEGEHAMLNHIIDKDPVKPSTKFSSFGAAAVDISQQREIDPSKLQKILKGELDWVIMKALEKDRKRRYGTANEFASDVERYLNNEAVTARPPSTGYRVSKFVTKNRGMVGAIVTIAAMLVVAAGISSWFAVQANEARVEAETSKEATERLLVVTQEAERSALSAQKRAQDAKALADQQRRHAENERQVADQVTTILKDMLKKASVFEQANRGFDASTEMTVSDLLRQAASDFSPAKLAQQFPERPEVQAEILATIADASSLQNLHHTAKTYNAAAIQIRQQMDPSPRNAQLSIAQSNQVFYTLFDEDFVACAEVTNEFMDALDRTLHLTEDEFPDAEKPVDLDQEIESRVTMIFDALGQKWSAKNIVMPNFEMGSLGEWDGLVFAWHHRKLGSRIFRVRNAMIARFGENDIKTVYMSVVQGFYVHVFAEFANIVRRNIPSGFLRLSLPLKIYVITNRSILFPVILVVANTASRLRTASYREPVEIYRRVLELSREHHQDRITEIAGIQIVLAVAMERSQGSTSESTALLEDSFKKLNKELGAKHPALLSLSGLLAASYDKSQNYEKAIGVLEPLLARWSRTYGMNHREVQLIHDKLLHFYIQRCRNGKLTKEKKEETLNRIEQITDRVLRWGKDGFADEPREHLVNVIHYMQMLFELGRHEKVVEYYKQYLPFDAKLLRTEPEYFSQPASLAAASHRALGDYESEVDCLEKLIGDRKELFKDQHHPLLESAKIRLAVCKARKLQEDKEANTENEFKEIEVDFPNDIAWKIRKELKLVGMKIVDVELETSDGQPTVVSTHSFDKAPIGYSWHLNMSHEEFAKLNPQRLKQGYSLKAKIKRDSMNAVLWVKDQELEKK